MRHIAIIGSGPAGYYTAEAAIKEWGEDIRVDVFDRLPVPYGLIRTGVAPDHQTIKAVSRRYEKTALTRNVRFVGNIAIGKDISLAELQALYDAVIIATGAPHDRDLGIPGDNLPGVIGSASFVGWYNGHPSFTDLDPDLSGRRAVVIGNGNVALDIARILSKTRREFAGSDIVAHALDAIEGSQLDEIVILGRRGPHQIAMTPKELGELRELERAAPHVDPGDLPPAIADEALEPGQRKSVQWLRQFAEDDLAKPLRISFDFFARPVRILGTDRVEGVEVERTIVTDGRLNGTGEFYMIPCHLVISAIGYRSAPIPGAPFDEGAGRFASDDGRISASPETGGLYCVGWARRGPTGTIGTNKPDGFAIIAKLAEDIASGAIGPEGKAGRSGFNALAAERKLDIVTFRDWQKIEEAEIAAARSGAPREKFTLVEEMIRAGR
ncbi:FAD-dependent oxidoreductase [Croceicoccus marinus]|uniref:FAD-dependent oxidoreductase n=1 Tax=Croceicoccus marinus TaxID=450378 RepID=A0A7G6VWI8_9SPHN|nr:FAD-dependent oxidoreductase [Croceicoccus marinus]QNE06103.1 FAD-dependent oxidoreductase [Croceicoccus marinus]